ncbi:ATP-binding protein [Streptomyces sp. NPDC059866]|uniref:ATP-binding protein n=1 Tax=Streptomyces sp. NPDC059866 TaxID=3346978 RepID=UPI00366365BC
MRAHWRARRRTARVEYHLPCEEDSACCARRLTQEFLTRDQAAVHSADVDDAVLVASELVANATRHGRSCCRLRLSVDDANELTIEVHDDSPLRPCLREQSLSAESGRGIALVRAVSRRLSVACDSGGGKTVRAVLPAT